MTGLFLLGPRLFGVFGLAMAAVAVVAGWSAQDHVPAKVGIALGAVAGVMILGAMAS